MTNKEKEREIDMGLMSLLNFCNEYFKRDGDEKLQSAANIYKRMMKRQTKKLVELLEGDRDNIIKFPELRK